MPLEYTAPPIERSHSQGSPRYTELIDALINADGGWVSLPLDEVGGDDLKDKQRSIHTAARARKFRVQTTVQGERIYARRRPTI
jgi:hypothetical protein